MPCVFRSSLSTVHILECNQLQNLRIVVHRPPAIVSDSYASTSFVQCTAGRQEHCRSTESQNDNVRCRPVHRGRLPSLPCSGGPEPHQTRPSSQACRVCLAFLQVLPSCRQRHSGVALSSVLSKWQVEKRGGRTVSFGFSLQARIAKTTSRGGETRCGSSGFRAPVRGDEVNKGFL